MRLIFPDKSFRLFAPAAMAVPELVVRRRWSLRVAPQTMARLIQDTIRRALAEELLFGRLANGGKVTIDVDADNKVKLDISEEKVPVTQEG